MSKTETTTTQVLPSYIDDATKGVVNRATGFSNKPYPIYPNQRIAGFTPDQTNAFGMTRSSLGSWKPYAQAAGRAASSSWTTPGTQQKYMSPYLNQVMGDTTREMMRAAGIQQKGIDRSALASNAFGDSRHALLQSEFDRNLQDTVSRTANQIAQQGYESGMGQFNSEQARALQGNMALAQLYPQLGLQDAGALWGIGSQQQAMNQQNLSQAYEDFTNQYMWPAQQMNWLTGILQGTPYSTSQTTKAPSQGSNDLASGIGAFSALVGGLGSLFGSGGIQDLWK